LKRVDSKIEYYTRLDSVGVFVVLAEMASSLLALHTRDSIGPVMMLESASSWTHQEGESK
jgi:hypothetical protein